MPFQFNKNNYFKVKIKNPKYEKFNGSIIYFSKDIYKRQGDVIKYHQRGFKAGKYLFREFERLFKKRPVIVFTNKKNEIINKKYLFINYYEWRGNFYSIYGPSCIKAVSSFFQQKLGIDKKKLREGIVLSRVDRGKISKSFDDFLEGFTKKQRREAYNKLAAFFRENKIDDIKLLDNLTAAIKQNYYIEQLDALKSLIDKNYLRSNIKKKWEKKYTTWLRKNYWIFGIDYKRLFPKQQLTSTRKIDIGLETYDGHIDVVEVKVPNIEIFDFDKNHKNYYFTKELALALAQAINYLHEIEEEQIIINKKNPGARVRFLKPRCKLIIGHEKIWKKEEIKEKKKALRLLNASLHNIEIFTFDGIVSMGDQMVENYKKVSK